MHLLCRVEVRSYMAADRVHKLDTGIAMLNGFLTYADAVGSGSQSKVILAFNKVLVCLYECRSDIFKVPLL